MLGMPAKRIYMGSTPEERGRLLHNSSEESQTTSGQASNPGQREAETPHEHVEADVILCDAPPPDRSLCPADFPCEDGANCPKPEVETEAFQNEAEVKVWRDNEVRKSKSKSSDISGATHKTAESREVASSREQKRRRSRKSTESRSAGRGGCSPARPSLQKVVYYQNRFITIPIDDSPARVGSGASGKASAGELSAGSGLSRITEIGKGPGQADRRGTAKMASAGQGTSRVNMQPIDMDKEEPEPTSRWKRRPTFLKKIAHFLQDNRLKTGNADTQEKLRTLNKTQEQSNPILKKILNIIFVTTGVSLLLAVVVVIIYTSIVTEDPGSETEQEPEVSTDRVARDVSLAAMRGKPGTNIGDQIAQQQNARPPSAPTTIAPTSPLYVVRELEEWDKEDYDRNVHGVKKEPDKLVPGFNDNFIDPNPHDYENRNPSSDKEVTPGQFWGPVNEKEEEDEDFYDPEYVGFIPVKNSHTQKPSRNKNGGRGPKPTRRPKGRVDEGYKDQKPTTSTVVTTTVIDHWSPPPDAIVDEFGIREKEYIHNYNNKKRHPKGKHHKRGRDKNRDRDDRLVGNVGKMGLRSSEDLST